MGRGARSLCSAMVDLGGRAAAGETIFGMAATRRIWSTSPDDSGRPSLLQCARRESARHGGSKGGGQRGIGIGRRVGRESEREGAGAGARQSRTRALEELV